MPATHDVAVRPTADSQTKFLTMLPLTAAARIDLSAWFRTLPTRSRTIAKLLPTGEATGAVARKFCLTAARISQLRREFEQSWQAFHDKGAIPIGAATGTLH